MASKLRKDGNAFADHYVLSGGTQGAPSPGTRTVRELRVIGMTAENSPDGLAPLAVYPELQRVTVENSPHVWLGDLSAASAHTVILSGRKLGVVDLTGLERATGLRTLRVLEPSSLRFGETVSLPTGLRELSVGDTGDAPGWMVSFIESVDWRSAPQLSSLSFDVLQPPFPTIDLSFAHELPLKRLAIFGIYPTDPSALRAAVPAVTGADDLSLSRYRAIGG